MISAIFKMLLSLKIEYLNVQCRGMKILNFFKTVVFIIHSLLHMLFIENLKHIKHIKSGKTLVGRPENTNSSSLNFTLPLGG